MNGQEPRIRVLIVEDHPVVAEGITALLAQYCDFEVLGWAGTVADALEAARAQLLHVVVVDLRLPDGSGTEVAEGVRELDPETAVVFLSADDSEEAMVAAVEAGASGYLTKSAGGDEVAVAVRQAAEGENLISASKLAALMVRRREMARERAEQAGQWETLTEREREILALMSRGLDNRELAAHFHISYGTVRSHVRNILRKLRARSKLEAVVKAADWGVWES